MRLAGDPGIDPEPYREAVSEHFVGFDGGWKQANFPKPCLTQCLPKGSWGKENQMTRRLESPPVAAPVAVAGPIEVRGLDPKTSSRSEQRKACTKGCQGIVKMFDDMGQGDVIVMFAGQGGMGQAALMDRAAVFAGERNRARVGLESRSLVTEIPGDEEKGAIPAADVEDSCRGFPGTRQMTNPVQRLSLPFAPQNQAGHGEGEGWIQLIAQRMIEKGMVCSFLDALQDARAGEPDRGLRNRMGEIFGVRVPDARPARARVKPARAAPFALPESPLARRSKDSVAERLMHPDALDRSADRAVGS